jgi:cell division protein FtsI (penicillin-binding protein 3)
VSLLQVARAYTVFTNQGRLLPLALTRVQAEPVAKQLFGAQAIAEVVRMMEGATQAGGTALRAQVPGYRVAGKTGTANKPENGGYAEHKYVSSFVGFGPVSDPRFIVAVMLDEPAGKYYGGDVGAPVFASVMGAALRLASVPPDAGDGQRSLQALVGSDSNVVMQRGRAKGVAHELESDPGGRS